MRAVSKKKAKADREYKMACTIVRERSGEWCEARLAGCGGLASHVHHVLPRSAGGTHDPENLLHLCEPCHTYTHGHPAEARALGLLRSRYEEAG